jgi:hypothetical protein
MRINNRLRVSAVLLCASAAALADTHIKAKYTADGRVTESVTYIKDQRQRIEYGKDMAVLNQADAKKMVQINIKTKTYRILPLEPEKPADTETRKGGVVIVTTTVTDTGERKQVFGFAARHLKTSVQKQPSPDACDSKAERIETDGWYIDLDVTQAQPPQTSPGSGCVDEIRNNLTGPANLGYPVQYTMTASGTSVTMEVVELSTATLHASLFEIPAGFSPEAEAKKSSLREASPKLANTMRIGMVFHNKSDQKLSQQALDEPIASAMHDLVTEVVLLEAPDVEATAKEKECDYILYTDLVEVKKSAVSKVGGMLSRASRGGSAKETFEARLDYKLLRVGGAGPLLESSATGKSGGGFDLRGAVRLATTAGSLAMSMSMYPRLFSMMGQGGGGFGAGMPNLDPTMNSLSFLFRASSQAPESGKAAPGDITAISAALDREGKAVMAELHKKK